MGLNGSGKSSLMKIIFGDPLTENCSIRIDGKSLNGGRRYPTDIRYLPQHNFIPNHLQIRRVMDDFEVDAYSVLNLFPELQQFINLKVEHLSGGWKRIFEVYLILSSKTKFVLLDEPFSHIMPLHVETIKNLILKEKANKGMLISDHLFEHLLEITDDNYLLKYGQTMRVSDEKDLDEYGYINLK